MGLSEATSVHDKCGGRSTFQSCTLIRVRVFARQFLGLSIHLNTYIDASDILFAAATSHISIDARVSRLAIEEALEAAGHSPMIMLSTSRGKAYVISRTASD